MNGAKYSYTVDQQDVDFSRRASATAMVKYLLSAAGCDAVTRGFGVTQINSDNHTWVLSRLAIEFAQMPKMGDRLEIRTWVSDAERLLSTRNFEVSNDSGEVVAVATSRWSMIDLSTRRAINLSTMEMECVDELPPIDPPRRVDTTSTQLVAQHRAAYSDIDFNCHVNTLRYIDMMLDAMPFERLQDGRVARLDIHFMRESKIGELLSIKRSGGIFEITHEDGTVSIKAEIKTTKDI